MARVRHKYITAAANKVAPFLHFLGGSMLEKCEFMGREHIDTFVIGAESRAAVINQFRTVDRHWSISLYQFFKNSEGEETYSWLGIQNFFGNSSSLDEMASKLFKEEIGYVEGKDFISWGYHSTPVPNYSNDDESEKIIVDWFSEHGAYDLEHCEKMVVRRMVRKL